MRWLVRAAFVFLLLGVYVGVPQTAHAASLKMQPLLYKDSLKQGEKKKGFVDVVNPTGRVNEVKFSVEEFKQINDNGSLKFYADEHIAAGVKLDVDSVSLGAHEAVRLYFELDGTKLPSGDVFAVIFATVTETQASGPAQAVRVGTLFVLENGTPSPKNAEIKHLSAPLLYTGNEMWANFTIRNVADPKSNTGFFPTITVEMWPYEKKTLKGPLVFAGRSRTIDLKQPGSYLGPIKITVQVGPSSKTVWAFAITGFYRWAVPLSIMVIVGLALIIRLSFKRHKMSL